MSPDIVEVYFCQDFLFYPVLPYRAFLQVVHRIAALIIAFSLHHIKGMFTDSVRSSCNIRLFE